jgi:5-methylcytosine-specific restriction endonuclease McrA
VTLDELISRDGETCVWCGGSRWRDDLTAEHLLPRSRGGRGIPENLAVACRSCNRRRRSRGVAAYARLMMRQGRHPGLDRLAAHLERLAASGSTPHAAYGQRQLILIRRLQTNPSSAPR